MNKICHIYNGNVVKKYEHCLKLLQWNKGNSHFETKISDIQNVITNHKPDILALSEANVKSNYKIYNNQFPEYIFETNLMFNIAKISRNVLLIKKGLWYNRRHDLEQIETCTIWIEVKFSAKKSVLIMGGYRQWTALKTMDIDNKSNSQSNKLLGLRDYYNAGNWHYLRVKKP